MTLKQISRLSIKSQAHDRTVSAQSFLGVLTGRKILKVTISRSMAPDAIVSNIKFIQTLQDKILSCPSDGLRKNGRGKIGSNR
jgi:hypothetical protein